MNQQDTPDPTSRPPGSLPQLSEATIKRFRRQPPAFAVLYRQLQQADPVAARWLLDATESVAAADPAEKEKYAALVLGFYHMLEEELLVGRFSWLNKASFDVAAEPSADIKRPPTMRHTTGTSR